MVTVEAQRASPVNTWRCEFSHLSQGDFKCIQIYKAKFICTGRDLFVDAKVSVCVQGL